MVPFKSGKIVKKVKFLDNEVYKLNKLDETISNLNIQERSKIIDEIKLLIPELCIDFTDLECHEIKLISE